MFPERLVRYLGQLQGRLLGAASWFVGRDRRPQPSSQRSEILYHQLVNNLREVVFQADAVGNWLFLNAAWTDCFGYSIEESLGRNFLEFVHPDDRAWCTERVAELIGADDERLRLQAAALDHAANGIIITEPEGTIVWVIPAFTSITGYSPEEVVGRSAEILTLDMDDPAQRAAPSRGPGACGRFRRADGRRARRGRGTTGRRIGRNVDVAGAPPTGACPGRRGQYREPACREANARAARVPGGRGRKRP